MLYLIGMSVQDLSVNALIMGRLRRLRGLTEEGILQESVQAVRVFPHGVILDNAAGPFHDEQCVRRADLVLFAGFARDH